MTHMMAQYSPVSIISLTTCQKICFNPPLLVSFLYRCHASSCLHPVLTCISLLLFPLCLSGLLISAVLYLLLLRGGGFSAENAPLQLTPLLYWSLGGNIADCGFGGWCVILCQSKYTYSIWKASWKQRADWSKEESEGKLLFLGCAFSAW